MYAGIKEARLCSVNGQNRRVMAELLRGEWNLYYSNDNFQRVLIAGPFDDKKDALKALDALPEPKK